MQDKTPAKTQDRGIFTTREIRNLVPEDKPYRHWEGSGRDNDTPGFHLRVSPGGTKAFYLFYRFNGRHCYLPLGKFPHISLKDARERAREALAELAKGLDPIEERKRQRDEQEEQRLQRIEAEKRERSTGTVADLAELYLKDLEERGRKTIKQVAYQLTSAVLPAIGKKKAQDITPDDILTVLAPFVERKALIRGNRVRSIMASMFTFGMRWDHSPKAKLHPERLLFHITTNPVSIVEKPQKKEAVGETELNWVEIRDFWLALDDVPMPTCFAPKLLLAVGGQRVGEVLNAAWEEFDIDNAQWEIPGARTKNGQTHLVPLTKTALELLEALQKHTGSSPYLFPKTRHYHDESKHTMFVSSVARVIRELCKEKGLKPLSPRDIRRTCKTRMAEIGIEKEIRDKLHNHAGRDVADRHYDKWGYWPEKQRAMAKWDRRLRKAISGEPAKVVAINE
ncbi:MAG: integrase arm-type DNA-binding domain-containing protein [Gammaproteobacteria bacterium]|nr:integrase arm-type DNA-binding domain-containing protein [Gammaproteobacteria bacterium]